MKCTVSHTKPRMMSRQPNGRVMMRATPKAARTTRMMPRMTMLFTASQRLGLLPLPLLRVRRLSFLVPWLGLPPIGLLVGCVLLAGCGLIRLVFAALSQAALPGGGFGLHG